MAGRYGEISSDLSLGAGQSIRRNLGDDDFEAFDPNGGGSYPVIYDDSIYKITGSAISFDTGLTVAVTGSVAFVNAVGASIGTHIYIASQNGAAVDTDLTTGGGTDDTVALQTILNQATGSNAPIMLVMDAPALVSGLNVYGNTTIFCLDGAGFYLNSGSNRAIIRNANRTRLTGSVADENISLIGGYYNGNKAYQDGINAYGTQETDSTYMSAIQMFGVNNLTVRDLKVVNYKAFSINVANAINYSITDYYFDAGANETFTQDGIHLNGPCYLGYIGNVRGHSWDDAIAINAGDDAALDLTIGNEHGPYIGQGPITDLVVDGVILDNCRTVVRLLNHGTNARIHRLKITNVVGSVVDEALIMGSEAVGTSSMGDITLENWSIEVPYTAGHSNAMMLINGTAESLIVRNLRVHNPTTSRSIIWFASTASVTIFELDGFSIYESGGSLNIIPVQVDGYVARFVGHNWDWARVGVALWADQFIQMAHANSHIADLNLSNIETNLVNYILNKTAGSLDYVFADNIRHLNSELSQTATFRWTSSTGTSVLLSNWWGYDAVNGSTIKELGDAFGTQVSSNDRFSGFLNGKLVEGAGISLTEVNNGANETLRISYTGTSSSSTPTYPAIYDNDTFKVTGTTLVFRDGLTVSSSGSIAYIDWTGTAGVTDHGALTGLLDNDHPQYVLTGTVSGGGHTIQDDGVSQTQRTYMNFVGNGFVLYDDAGNNATIISGTAGTADLPYGCFSDSTTQTITGSTSGAYAIKFDTDEYKYKITHTTGTVSALSKIYVDEDGIYLITFSAIGKSALVNKTLDIWLAVDGVNVPRSNTVSKFVGTANERIITVTYIYEFTAGQYFELYWRSDDGGTTLVATAAGTTPTRPASPSIILTINKISPMTVGPQGIQGLPGLPGGNTLYYDDSVFRVTGTSVSFDTNLSVAVTGSTAFVSAPDAMTWTLIQASQLVNEVKGWPPVVGTGSSLSTLNLWWDDVGTVSLGAQVVPLASEGITEDYELAMKVIASSGSSGVYQRYTYADEPRVKSSRKLSALVAIWSVGGASITAKLVNSDASSTSATAVTTAAWNIVEIPNHTLAGTYCDLQIVTTSGAGTFYVVPLGVNIGTKGFPLRPRVGIYKDVHTSLISANDPGGADWADLDMTTATSNLAYMVQLHGLYNNATTAQSSLSVRRNGSSEGQTLGNELARTATTTLGTLMRGTGIFYCDDGQIVEWKTGAAAGNTESVYIDLMGWWEWE